MPSILERAGEIWNRLSEGPTQLPTRLAFAPDHVKGGPSFEAFQPNQQYFQVRINEMYLRSSRQWFSQYDPMVFIVSEFTYDKRVEALPFWSAHR